MDVTTLSQWQFAITCVYHFFFVPLTLGLSILTAIMQTFYYRTGDEVYKQMTKFWGKLFLINFAMGVVTGIVMEFQFGMNWANYSRFVGDIFGAPLAIEALLAFFLESTFLGLWIFGWEKLPKGLHLTAIWVAAIGSNLSALWILIANSFMQNPVGYQVEVIDGVRRAIMTDFGALVFNPNIFTQFPHTIFSGYATAGFFVLGISAWHLLRQKESEVFRRSFKFAAIFSLVSVLLVGLFGHQQAQRLVVTQPMKMAAAEALWISADPAGLSLFSIVNESAQENSVDLRIPGGLSFLSYNTFTGQVRGIKDIQAEYEQTYGPGNYIPPVFISFWTFRIMVVAAMLMILLSALGWLYISRPKWYAKIPLLGRLPFLKILLFSIALPYIANTTGWLLTELGRQPWVVFGELKTANAASPTLTPELVLFSLVVFTLVYGVLMVADVYLLTKFAKKTPELAPVPVRADK